MYTPQQNDIVERKHRHILNVARALRFQSNLPLSFLRECVLTEIYLINRLPTPLLNQKSPFELLYNKPPTYSHLQVFGCLCYATIVHPYHKFDSRACRCIFLGYLIGKKGYKSYDLDSHHFLISRDVTFHETIFPYAEKHLLPLTHPVLPLPLDPPHPDPFPISSHSNPLPSSEPNTRFDTHHQHGSSLFDLTPSSPSSLAPTPVPTRQSTRLKRPSSWQQYDHLSNAAVSPYSSSDPMPSLSGTHHPLSHFLSLSRFSPSYRVFLANISGITEPASYTQVVKDPHWQDAMQYELNALEQQNTWTLMPLPYGHKPIGCKWVYKIKYKYDGAIDRYKACLAAKGYTQIEGIDYQETFSPTAKLTTLHCLLAVASARGWFIHQLDIHNAFLHGDLIEVVYMDPPSGLR